MDHLRRRGAGHLHPTAHRAPGASRSGLRCLPQTRPTPVEPRTGSTARAVIVPAAPRRHTNQAGHQTASPDRSRGAAFGGVLFLLQGPSIAGQYFAGCLLEKGLSVDNTFVLVLLSGSLAVPATLRRRSCISECWACSSSTAASSQPAVRSSTTSAGSLRVRGAGPAGWRQHIPPGRHRPGKELRIGHCVFALAGLPRSRSAAARQPPAARANLSVTPAKPHRQQCDAGARRVSLYLACGDSSCVGPASR